MTHEEMQLTDLITTETELEKKVSKVSSKGYTLAAKNHEGKLVTILQASRTSL